MIACTIITLITIIKLGARTVSFAARLWHSAVSWLRKADRECLRKVRQQIVIIVMNSNDSYNCNHGNNGNTGSKNSNNSNNGSSHMRTLPFCPIHKPLQSKLRKSKAGFSRF